MKSGTIYLSTMWELRPGKSVNLNQVVLNIIFHQGIELFKKTSVILHTAMIFSTKPHPYQFKRNGYILQLLTVKWKHRFPIGNFHCML